MYYNRSFFAACRLSFLILAGFCLSACFDNDATTDPVQTLITIDPQAISLGNPGFWVYATDAGGYVLDVQNTVGRERLKLSSKTPVDKFNLTLVSGTVSTNGRTYVSIRTYADVQPGTTLDIVYGTGGLTMIDPGKVSFKINGYNGIEHGINFTNRGYYLDYEETIAGGSFSAELQMCRMPSDVLLTTYRGGTPVYAKIPSVKHGDYIELEMNEDFKPFEHQRKLDFDGYYNNGWVLGAYLDKTGQFPELFFDLIDTYDLSGTIDNTNEPVIGYVDGFDIYEMYVHNSQPSGHVSYFKQGNIQDSFDTFTMPTFTYKVTNTELRNFTFDFSEDFTYYSAYFGYESASVKMNWMISAPSGVQINIGNLPREIQQAYPMIQTELFKYSGCQLTKVINGESYNESILRSYMDRSPEFEYYTFSPNP